MLMGQCRADQLVFAEEFTTVEMTGKSACEVKVKQRGLVARKAANSRASHSARRATTKASNPAALAVP